MSGLIKNVLFNDNKHKLDVANEKIKCLETRNEEVTSLYDNVRGFRHDFSNMLQIMGGYISLNDIDGLKKYYKNLTIACKDANNFKLPQISNINEPTIFNLIFSKSQVAHESNIEFNLISLTDLKLLNVDIYEYTRILGVILDNAIEAASECEHKIVNITFEFDKDSQTINCIVENTYVNKNIDLDRIFEKNFTTKSRKKNSGLGLWGVKKILDEEKTIELITQKDDIFFSQKLSCECV